MMKRLLALWMVLTLLCILSACSSAENQATSNNSQETAPSQTADASAGQPETSDQYESSSASGEPDSSQPALENTTGAPDADSGQTENILVAYFSATGNTEGVANTLQGILDADLYEIVPEDPYEAADLDYGTDECRANQEQNDPEARPAVSGSVGYMEDYNVVFLGYPIWWGQAPKIISTFLESYDFADKIIVPFCTSGSSGIGSSADNLHALAPDAQWLTGQRFAGGATESTVAAWVEELQLPDIR